MPRGVNDPQHWRDRAVQMRMLASMTEDPEAAATMLKLADNYDELAERTKVRVGEANLEAARRARRGA